MIRVDRQCRNRKHCPFPVASYTIALRCNVCLREHLSVYSLAHPPDQTLLCPHCLCTHYMQILGAQAAAKALETPQTIQDLVEEFGEFKPASCPTDPEHPLHGFCFPPD